MERIRANLAQEALRHRAPDSHSKSIIEVYTDSSDNSPVAAGKPGARPPVILDSDGENSDNELHEVDEELSLNTSLKVPVIHSTTAHKHGVGYSSIELQSQSHNGFVLANQRPQFNPLHPTTNVFPGTKFKSSSPVIIPVPSNRPPGIRDEHETFDLPQDLPGVYEVRKTSAEADRELKELFAGGIDDGQNEINMEEAIVEGFTDGIVLKPHQVKARVWMRERETGKKAGGLLCDDMGLGKTIQTVVRIVDGPPSREDRKKGWAHSTLVICPLALVKQWAQEIKKYTGHRLRVVEHHGQSRTTDPDVLASAHVVITSYAVVASEYSTWRGASKDESTAKAKKKKALPNSSSDSGDSDGSSTFGDTLKNAKAKKSGKQVKKPDGLFRVQWWRIVLDEAHNIKNRNTKQAQACFALSAKNRWALTGTPVQNNIEDLFSLLKFLRIKPLHEWSQFNESIAKPIKNGRSSRAMKRLHVVMKAIMLRRLKDTIHDGAPLIELPPRTVEIMECDFDEDERAFYTALEEKTSLTMNKFVKQGEVMHNYTQVMVLLLRLRQACNHPSLVSKASHQDVEALEPGPMKNGKHDSDEDAEGLADLFLKMDVNAVKRCEICQTLLHKRDTSDISKTTCEDCENQFVAGMRRKFGRLGTSLPPSSAKLRKILELLKAINKSSDGREKTIVFSQFTSMLDLIQLFLRDAGIQYVRYDGSMNPKQRETSLQAIRENKSICVILISFKAGGAGLNLTSCNNVILTDLWWNPALEEQAFGRVHRYGQERPVMVYKLTVDQTIETRILALQDRKRELAQAALSGDRLKSNKLGEDEILALFRHDTRDSDDE